MSISVSIPTLLRPLTNGEKKVQAQGASVGEVIEHLEGQFPGIKARLMSGEDLHRFVNIYVNEEDIRFLGGATHQFSDGDEVMVVPSQKRNRVTASSAVTSPSIEIAKAISVSSSDPSRRSVRK